MQYENHPETGEHLIDEEVIIKALEHKSIKKWAYICHDEDVYSEKDEEDDAKHIQGQKKPPHWHIVMQCSTAVEPTVIAKWLNIKENFVDVPKGVGAFLDCVQYLTHEGDKQQGLGKRLYEDERVKANFKFREELDKRTENRLKYGRDLDPKDQMRHNVMFNGWTLSQCVKADRITYMSDFEKLRKCRLDYIQNRAEAPALRINYYIEGLGGMGKNVASRALARVLCPGLEEEECFFEVGGNNVSFDGYDGQPVIIWNDTRAMDLIMKFGRSEAFDIFDSHPTTANHHIKYGSIRLINSINIINGIQPYEEFLNSLAGEYTNKDGMEFKSEDKGQTYRRFPIILCLREDDFDVLLNKGVANGTREYNQYIATKHMQGSFQKLIKHLEGDAKTQIEEKMLKPVIEATVKVRECEKEKISDPSQIPEEFLHYGEPIEFKRENNPPF